MRIVVVEDCRMIRGAITSRLKEKGYRVVGETGGSSEAITLCIKFKPHVVLLDMQLEEGDGWRVLDELARLRISVKVIVMSGFINDYVVNRISRAHIAGFVDKNHQTIDALFSALTAIDEGQTWFSDGFQFARRELNCAPHAFHKLLSSNEQIFLGLVSRGLSDTEIAEQLGVSKRTAEGTRNRIEHKLSVKSTPKLMMYAREKGFDLFPPQNK